MGSGIRLTNNQTKSIIKLITSLQKREILSKKTPEKIIVHEAELPYNFLVPLMIVGLPLMKNVLTP